MAGRPGASAQHVVGKFKASAASTFEAREFYITLNCAWDGPTRILKPAAYCHKTLQTMHDRKDWWISSSRSEANRCVAVVVSSQEGKKAILDAHVKIMAQIKEIPSTKWFVTNIGNLHTEDLSKALQQFGKMTFISRYGCAKYDTEKKWGPSALVGLALQANMESKMPKGPNQCIEIEYIVDGKLWVMTLVESSNAKSGKVNRPIPARLLNWGPGDQKGGEAAGHPQQGRSLAPSHGPLIPPGEDHHRNQGRRVADNPALDSNRQHLPAIQEHKHEEGQANGKDGQKGAHQIDQDPGPADPTKTQNGPQNEKKKDGNESLNAHVAVLSPPPPSRRLSAPASSIPLRCSCNSDTCIVCSKHADQLLVRNPAGDPQDEARSVASKRKLHEVARASKPASPHPKAARVNTPPKRSQSLSPPRVSFGMQGARMLNAAKASTERLSRHSSSSSPSFSSPSSPSSSSSSSSNGMQTGVQAQPGRASNQQ